MVPRTLPGELALDAGRELLQEFLRKSVECCGPVRVRRSRALVMPIETTHDPVMAAELEDGEHGSLLGPAVALNAAGPRNAR